MRKTLTDILTIAFPIIQAPMLGVSTPEMAATVSIEGGLGSLPVGGLSPETTRQLIRQTKSLTNKPFAVNLFAHDIPNYTENELEPMRQLILKLAEKRGYHLDIEELTGFKFYNHLDQIDILVEENIDIVSFTFGCLDSNSIHRLQQNGCILIGTATCVEEALYLQKQGIDMISVQGIEAGGHRGSFIKDKPLPQVGLFALLPQVRKYVDLPCIAAGGINNASTIKAAFDLGADGIQVGTAFIGTHESLAIPSYKTKLQEAGDINTVLTRALSGRWARGLRNELMQDIEQAGITIPPYPLQNSLTTAMRKLAQQNDDSEYTSLWAGQSTSETGSLYTKEVFGNLTADYTSLGK
ncbi:NAD(P)H-dependent flavin oxidoreductase [Niabella hibiscisoli]|uniref:NAD(P)H-dependent flavin oxidoreductase n=1 Tax=Niabella hibiscisoli TaxID=1825928 RepID=UPI001F10CCCB|nr:nitronate monooxygenase [Niabella hibiscisoli]MCH5721118.1 nitronate monooxygenase [Niabella hibiscisoli]